jgi:hypothetical protein
MKILSQVRGEYKTRLDAFKKELKDLQLKHGITVDTESEQNWGGGHNHQLVYKLLGEDLRVTSPQKIVYADTSVTKLYKD